ncbi:MAG: hypothetical protein ACTSUN_08865 [Promethearchaeota archaeon]
MGLFGGKKKKKQSSKFDIRKKIQNLKTLIESGRSKEAIAYIYLIYNELIKNKYNKPRLPYQTIREYAITCVNELNQKPENVYPFVSKVESIIYGGIKPDKEDFQSTIQLFSNIYQEVTGTTLSINL